MQVSDEDAASLRIAARDRDAFAALYDRCAPERMPVVRRRRTQPDRSRSPQVLRDGTLIAAIVATTHTAAITRNETM